MNEVTKVECVHTDIEKNLFGFAIKDLVDKIVNNINNGYAICVTIEVDDLENFEFEQQQKLVVVLSTIKDHLCIIGFEDEIDDDTLDKIKDIVCDAGMVELPDVCDRIIAFNPNGFFSYV
jgi:hypothetical protein